MHDPASDLALAPGDVLLIVDVQNDYLPGGALAVPHGDEVLPLLNRWAARFHAARLPVVAARDWHPALHCSFKSRGGYLPPHCVAGTFGAEFPRGLRLPAATEVVAKGTQTYRDACSAFEGTQLTQRLNVLGARRVFVAGLPAESSVMATTMDALMRGWKVLLLADATRATERSPGDGARAVELMRKAGAHVLRADAGQAQRLAVSQQSA